MKAKVDQTLCTGCGLCEGLCPEVFLLDDNDLSQVQLYLIPKRLKNCTLSAEIECPVGAISHEE